LRTELARETRVPPYVVFHDATLRELARALPRDEKSFLAVKGAGPGRWQRYGERVVAITAAAPPVGSASDPALPLRADLPPEVPAEETTPVVQEAEEQQPFPFAGEEHPGLAWLSARPAPQGARSSAGDLWKLCASGATLADICLRLKRSAADVASEIANGAQRGKPVDVARLLGAERVEAIRAAARGANGDVVAVRRRLSFPAALAEIRLALAASQSRR
jgi:hypothetical protein